MKREAYEAKSIELAKEFMDINTKIQDIDALLMLGENISHARYRKLSEAKRQLQKESDLNLARHKSLSEEYKAQQN